MARLYYNSLIAVSFPFAYVIDTSTVIIGRGKLTYGAANKICINDSRISRLHATIFFNQRDQCYRVIDGSLEPSKTRSTNGVFLNGERIYSALLKDGDIIQINNYYLYFEYHAKDTLKLSEDEKETLS
jgi:pSer/pThr/pTyr-binding forkhead associated (FHA) protein